MWHHIVGTYDGSSAMTVYVDSVVDATTSQPGLSPPNRDPTIGVRTSGQGYYGGDIADIRVYNKELTAVEVNELYQMRTQRHHYL